MHTYHTTSDPAFDLNAELQLFDLTSVARMHFLIYVYQFYVA